MKTQKQRFVWADLIRVIALYFMISIHSMKLPEKLADESILSVIIFAVLKTCVPLFIMISGALLLQKTENLKTFLTKRLFRLLFPWVTWTFLLTLWSIAFGGEKIQSLYAFLRFFQTNLLSFWFLPLIFGIYLLIPSIRILVKFGSGRHIFYLFTLWFITVSVLPFFHNTQAFPMFSDNGLVRQVLQNIGYVYIGYLFRREWGKSILPPSAFLFILGITVSVLQTISLSGNSEGNLRTDFLEYASPGIVIASVSLFVLLQYAGSALQGKLPSLIKGWLAAFSTASLGIYLVHHLYIRYLPQGNIRTTYMAFVFSGVILLLSYLTVAILQKVTRHPSYFS